MPTYTFSNFPKPIVSFGNKRGRTEYAKIQESMTTLKKYAATTAQAALAAAEYAKKTGVAAAKLAKSAQFLGTVSGVATVLLLLIGEVEQMYEELKHLEQKIFNTLLDGKMRALKRHLTNLQDENTSDDQKVAEIVSAVGQLDEMLPMFANEDSIFRERYWIGAPLFVNFCGILRAICLIAEELPGYNSKQLPSLKEDYQKMLDWFKVRCIGRRLASCYVKGMLAAPGCAWTHDWSNHYERYKKYYDVPAAAFPWMAYAMDLGGTGWRVWCGSMTYCSIIDLWDPRPYERVTFEKLEIRNTGDHPAGMGVGAAAAVIEIKYHRDVLEEYRRRVEKVMLDYFNAANLID